MTENNPYSFLPNRAFWKSALATRNLADIAELCRPKFYLSRQDRVVTAGSCFAQHIGRELVSQNFNFADCEPPPALLPKRLWNDYGYGLFSARYGNIYTTAQLKQLVLRTRGRFSPRESAWHTNGRYYDPFRPGIEPRGFESEAEVALSVASHLRCVRALFKSTDVFIFTLGLTEHWRSKDDGAVYPICPGTKVGTFDSSKYEFHNSTFHEIYGQLRFVVRVLRKLNPRIRILLTVSPVPLTATASGDHVLIATTASKSILRAVAHQICNEHADVDYFPSYEIITSPIFEGRFFEANRRSVTREGVKFVMKYFFREFCMKDTLEETSARSTTPFPISARPSTETQADQEELVCEEEILEWQKR